MKFSLLTRSKKNFKFKYSLVTKLFVSDMDIGSDWDEFWMDLGTDEEWIVSPEVWGIGL